MNAPHTLFPQVPPASTGPAMGQSHIHESARAQVAGAAHYIDDLPEVKGTLYAAPILSTVAHGGAGGGWRHLVKQRVGGVHATDSRSRSSRLAACWPWLSSQ